MVEKSLDRPTVGSRLREKRQETGISIRELARRTGFTASFISQVENEKANVSLDSLRRIADSLGVQILYFFTDLSQTGPAAYEGAFTPSGEKKAEGGRFPERGLPLIKADMRPRLFLPEPGITYELLSSRVDHKMEAFMGRIKPGSGNIARQLHVPTEEFIYCLSGSLKVGIRDQEFTMQPGDSVYFAGQDLIYLTSATETEESVWLSVITPPAF